MEASVKLEWNDIWMEMARMISSRSNDPTLKVGAVIVSQDNESVLAIGYNGDEKGGNNERDSEEKGESGFIHAEINAMVKMNYNDPRPRKIYLTHSPCSVCARAIVNANIQTVIYDKEYRKSTGLEILEKSGVTTINIHST